VGAAKDQGVDGRVGREQRAQVAAGDRGRDLVAGPALLGQRHQERAGQTGDPGPGIEPGDGLLVGPGADGRQGADDPDVPVFAGRQGAVGPGKDRADDRDLGGRGQRRQGGGRRGVAGDHHQLDPVAEQEPLAGQGVALDRARALGAVGDPGGVPQVDEVLARQGGSQGPDHGEPSDPGVEDADRATIHGAHATATARRLPSFRCATVAHRRIEAPATRVLQVTEVEVGAGRGFLADLLVNPEKLQESRGLDRQGLVDLTDAGEALLRHWQLIFGDTTLHVTTLTQSAFQPPGVQVSGAGPSWL
jgi:hypothetical protein